MLPGHLSVTRPHLPLQGVKYRDRQCSGFKYYAQYSKVQYSIVQYSTVQVEIEQYI